MAVSQEGCNLARETTYFKELSEKTGSAPDQGLIQNLFHEKITVCSFVLLRKRPQKSLLSRTPV